MNFSSSRQSAVEWPVMVSPLDYRDVSMMMAGDEGPAELDVIMKPTEEPSAQEALTPEELEALLSTAKADAVHECEQRLRREYDTKSKQESEKIQTALSEFVEQRKDYFARVEAEVIRLALAIAAKILHRESAADPMLVAAMVRVAIDRLQAGSHVSIRVAATEAGAWTEYMQHLPHGIRAEVIGDPHLNAGDCIMQTGLGSLNFGIEAQLKEVEQNFFDLLAKRPVLP